MEVGNKYVIERRLTRSVTREKRNPSTEVTDSAYPCLKSWLRSCPESMDVGDKYVMGRRVTRSMTREKRNPSIEVTDCGRRDDSSKKLRILSDEGNAKLGINLSEKFECNAEKFECNAGKRVVSSYSQVTFTVEKGNNKLAQHSDEIKAKGLPRESIKKSGDMECADIREGKDEKEENGYKGKTSIHKNRKRSRIEEEHGLVKGWTREQELALQKAYFTAKPTPHFWKKVARMVPGKSAQECFDRIQSENLTPSQPQTRSRAKRKDQSPVPLSASKLLNLAETKIKKYRSSKGKSLLAQRTVRQILQKQNADQDYEADLFTVLEPTTDSSSQFCHDGITFSTPEHDRKGLVFLQKCSEQSSSTHKKRLSALKSSCNAAFVSPPVLKPIKNKALHEKYIDQLHCREAKRKASSLRNAKCLKSKNDENKSQLRKVNPVKAAKDALIFDTQEAINQLRRQQLSKIKTDDVDEDYFLCEEDENEDEDGLV